MSRRKQYRPKLVKDEMDANGEPRSKRSAIKEEPVDTEDIQCQLCEEKFTSISDLQSHTIASHAQPQQPAPQALECQQCDAVLCSFSAFVIHMRSHLNCDGERRHEEAVVHYSCSHCPMQFNNIQTRQQHLLTHFETNLTRIQCTDCFFAAANPSSMMQHQIEKHLKTQHLCQICAQIFDSLKEYKEHCASHWINSIYSECVACRVPFESRELLMIHVQFVHDREEGCAEGAGSGTEPSMMRNPQTTSMEREKMLRVLHCSVCDAKCIGEEALDEHRLFTHCKVVHSDICAECFEPINNVDEFKKHTRAHIREMYMNCAVCRQSLRNESQLQLHAQFHMKRIETKIEEITEDGKMDNNLKAVTSSSQSIFEDGELKDCPFCRQTFKSDLHLRQHVQQSHQQIAKEQEDNSFLCGICNEIFESSDRLFSHLQSSKDCFASIRCPICALSFNTVSRFESHLKRHHNASTCTCQICGIAFLRNEELDEHMQQHKVNLELNRTLT